MSVCSTKRLGAWWKVLPALCCVPWALAVAEPAPAADAAWRDRFVLRYFAQTMQDPVRAAREARAELAAAQRAADPRSRLRAAARLLLATDEGAADCALADPLIDEARAGGPAFASDLFDVAVSAYLSLSDQHCKSFLSPDELESLGRRLGDPARLYFVLGARALSQLKANRFNDALLTLAEQADLAISDAQIAFSLQNRAQAELAANPSSNAARALLADAATRIDPEEYPALHLSQQVLVFRMEFAARHDAAAFDAMKRALPGTLRGLLGDCPSGFDLVTFARALTTAGRPAEAQSLLDEAKRFNTGCKKLVALRSRAALEVYTALGTPDAFVRGQQEIAELEVLLGDTRSFGPQTLRSFKTRASAFWQRFGRYDKALQALLEANKAGEVLQKISSETARVELQEKLNVAAKEKENARLKAEATLQDERQRGWILAFVVALGGVVGVGAALSVAVRRGRRLTQVSAELAERNQELEQRSASRIRLLAAACHDLRQPAHALGMQTELGDDAHHDPATFSACLQGVRRSTASLADMLDSLMDLGRLDGGHYTPLLGSISLPELMQDLTLHFSGLARRKGLALEVGPADGHVVSDHHLLRRIVFNLVSNAIKYTDAGVVQVTTQRSGELVTLTVRDTGPGIPPDKIDDVFRDHVRLDPAKAAEGLGIGLSIVRRGAELLGHGLTLTSPPGGGTRVTLTLPWTDTADAPAEPAQAPGSAAARPGLLALMEDDVEVRDAMAALLRRWGHDVCTGTDAQDLANQLQARQQLPDLVITDFHLANTNRLDEVDRLRHVLASPDLPALLVTGNLDSGLAARAASAGVVIAHKPLVPGKLATLVRRLCKPTSAEAAAAAA